MQLVRGGDLASLLNNKFFLRLEEREARFYAAEILLALEHLHGLDVVYR